jgi:hypothetical protein
MKQITEDYCSFEIAKLLKEKGFDGECRMTYREHDMQMIYYTPNPNDLLDFTTNREKLEKHSKKQHCDYALCPTHQMALKWLREVHDLHIVVYPWQADNEEKAIHWCCTVYKSFAHLGNDVYTNETPKSYEQAVEAALKYTLENLI